MSIKLKSDIAKEVEKAFIFSDLVVDCLYTGLVANKNVLLYGPGGYGKSEMTMAFFKAMGVEPFVQSCGEGLSEEKLFGGLDMKEYKDHGKLHYLVEHSFMNHEYVVFEELLDAPMNVLLSLKDILTSGYFRQGSQQFKIKTKLIVCLTNRTKAEVAEDDSSKALLERFPLELQVIWPDFKEEYFYSMFERVNSYNKWGIESSKMRAIAKLVATAHNSGNKVSPRTAVYALQVFSKVGHMGLSYIEGLSNENIQEIYKRQKQAEIEDQFRAKINAVKTDIRKDMDKLISDESIVNNPIKLIANVEMLVNKHNSAIEAIKNVPNSVAKEYADVVNGLQQFRKDMKNAAMSATEKLAEKHMAELSK